MAKKVAIVPAPRGIATLAGHPTGAATLQVVDSKPGPVTWLDKLKNGYHQLTTGVAALLVFLNEVTPLTGFLPDPARHWLSVALAVVGAAATFLKKNEQWVNDL